MWLMRATVAITAMTLSVATVRAESESEDVEAVSTSRRAAAVATAIVPGLLVHGTGLKVAGHDEAAKRVLALEGVGLGLILLGGVPLVATGASRKVSSLSVPLLVAGGGLFVTSWLADVYGAAGGGRSALGPSAAPQLEAEVGYGYVRDPLFEFRNFLVLAASYRFAAERITPSAWIAADNNNQRLRLEWAHRFIGPRAATRRARSFLELESAVTWHRYPDENFATGVIEAVLRGRLLLSDVSPVLAGSFIELGVGMGIEWFRFDTEPGTEHDVFSLALGDFAFGTIFGEPGQLAGEFALAYDHRRDDFAAGSAASTQGSGFAGHFGARARFFLANGYGLSAEGWLGSARVLRLSLAWQR